LPAEETACTLLKRWLAAPKSDIATRISAPAEIEALEARYGVSLPDDFREYLLGAQPAEENFDAEMTTWWPITRIRNIPEEYKHKIRNRTVAASVSQYLFFADHSIWCWAWAIACTDDENRGKIVVIGDKDPFVATSFTDFVRRYINDWASVC
jgi:cell wall assembly regulator SMI1